MRLWRIRVKAIHQNGCPFSVEQCAWAVSPQEALDDTLPLVLDAFDNPDIDKTKIAICAEAEYQDWKRDESLGDFPWDAHCPGDG